MELQEDQSYFDPKFHHFIFAIAANCLFYLIPFLYFGFIGLEEVHAAICSFMLATYLLYSRGRIDWGGNKACWHAAEHKTVNVLSSGLPMTIENLKAAPMVNASCGSMIAFNGFVCLMIFVEIVFWYEKPVLWAIYTPCYISALVLQRVMLVSEPTADIYQEALKIGLAIQEAKEKRALRKIRNCWLFKSRKAKKILSSSTS